jgi:hypothetical protein
VFIFRRFTSPCTLLPGVTGLFEPPPPQAAPLPVSLNSLRLSVCLSITFLWVCLSLVRQNAKCMTRLLCAGGGGAWCEGKVKGQCSVTADGTRERRRRTRISFWHNYFSLITISHNYSNLLATEWSRFGCEKPRVQDLLTGSFCDRRAAEVERARAKCCS